MRRLAAGVVWVFVAVLAVAPAAAQTGTALFAQAGKALDSGDAAKAVDLYSNAIRSGSLGKGELARAFLNRGRAQQFTGQHARAVADFTNALWLEALEKPDQAKAYGWRAVSRQALGQAKLAADDMGQARGLDSGFDPNAGGGAVAAAAAPVQQQADARPTKEDAGGGGFFNRIFGGEDTQSSRDTAVQREPIPQPQPAAGNDTSSEPGLLNRLLGDQQSTAAQPAARAAPAPAAAPMPRVASDATAPRSLLPSSTGTAAREPVAAPEPRPAPRLAADDEATAAPARPADGNPTLLSAILGGQSAAGAAEPQRTQQPPPPPQQVARTAPVRPAPEPTRPTGPALDEGSAWTTTANQARPIVRAAATPASDTLAPGVSNDIRAQPARLSPPPARLGPPPPSSTTVAAARPAEELESDLPPRQSIFARLFGSSRSSEPLRPPAPARAAAPVQPPPPSAPPSGVAIGAWDTSVSANAAPVAQAAPAPLSAPVPRNAPATLAAPAPRTAPLPRVAPPPPRNVEVASLDWDAATHVTRVTRAATPPPPQREAAIAPPRTVALPPARRIPQPGPEAAVRSGDTGYAVQIAARRSLDDAKRDAAKVTRRNADLFGPARPYIVKADVPGKGTYYRVRFGPYRDQPAVAGLCQRLKSRGQDCFTVHP